MSLLLLFNIGSRPGTQHSYWGPHFPPKGVHSCWDGHFPEDPDDIGIIFGPSPQGVATFVLELESGATVKYTWRTAIFKSYNGLEKRSSLIQDPVQTFVGTAFLTGDDTRRVRARLARYAALGQPFLLGLPYEELTLRADSTGSSVLVQDTSASDWCQPGVGVVVTHPENGSLTDVIQAVLSNQIDIVGTLGEIGRHAASIMPTTSVYLDPQQGFDRYPAPDAEETWHVTGRMATAGIPQAAVPAFLSLNDPVTHSGVLAGVTLVAQQYGADGNEITVTFSDDALTSGGEISEIGTDIHVKWLAGDTTLAQLADLINYGSSLIYMTGTWNATDTMTDIEDEFTSLAMSGGVDAGPIAAGVGATIATFHDSVATVTRPVWDHPIQVDDTAPDSIQAMNEIVDLGGLPLSTSMTSVADWGRAIKVRAALGDDWQWVKKFLFTIRGRFQSFWLPSWRDDLKYVSKAAGKITVESDEAGGDFYAWWPNRRHLQIWQEDGTLTYVRITNYIDNGDGTLTLDIVDGADVAVTISGAAVDMISWLEVVRLESDEAEVVFTDQRFEVNLVARVVQR